MTQYLLLNDIKTTLSHFKAGDILDDVQLDLGTIESAGAVILPYEVSMEPLRSRFNSLRSVDSRTNTGILYESLALAGLVGNGSSSPGYTFSIGNKTDLLTYSTYAAGVFTLHAGSYLVTGDIDLDEDVGEGTGPGDRIQAVSGNIIEGATSVHRIFSADDGPGVVLITGPSTGAFTIRRITLEHLSDPNGCVEINGEATSLFLADEVQFKLPVTSTATSCLVQSLGNVVIERCQYANGTFGIVISANSTTINVADCIFSGNVTNIFVSPGVTTLQRVQIVNCISPTVAPSANNIRIAGNITNLEIRGCNMQSAGSECVLFNPGSVTGIANIRNNVFAEPISILLSANGQVLNVIENVMNSSSVSVAIATGATWDSVRILDNEFAEQALSAAGTIDTLLFRGNYVDAATLCASMTSAVKGSQWLGNTFKCSNPQAVFSGVSRSTPGGTTVSAYTFLRGNLWTDGTNFFQMQESDFQNAANPSVIT